MSRSDYETFVSRATWKYTGNAEDTDYTVTGFPYGYIYSWQPRCVARIVKCKRKDCIYWSSESAFQETENGYCQNNSLMLDEFGACRCFVKNKKTDTDAEKV